MLYENVEVFIISSDKEGILLMDNVIRHLLLSVIKTKNKISSETLFIVVYSIIIY